MISNNNMSQLGTLTWRLCFKIRTEFQWSSSSQHNLCTYMCKICAKYAVFLAVMATVADFCSRPVCGVMQAQHVLNTWTSFLLWFSFVFMLIGILHVEYINKTVFKLSISIQMNPHLSLTTTFQLEFTSRNRNYICKRFIKSRPPTMWSQWL